MSMLEKFYLFAASFGAWIEAHPVFATVVFWPVVTGLITVVFKPRTPDEYAALASKNPPWLFTRLAALLQLIAGAGFDPVKVTLAFRKLLRGTVYLKAPAVTLVPPAPPAPPAPPPSGGSDGGAFSVLLLLGAIGLFSPYAACTRSDLFTIADIAADKVKCVVANQDLPDAEIFAKCAVQSDDVPRVLDLLSASRASAKKAADKAAAEKAAACAPAPSATKAPADAGVDAWTK